MNRYRELLSVPHVKILVSSALPARIAYGMVALSIFFKANHETNSIPLAGLAIGLNSLSGALTAGARGSLMDRYGQKWPLRIQVPAYSAMLSLSSHPGAALLVCSILMLIGGGSLGLTTVSKSWIPEVKEKGSRPLWRNSAMQLLMFEGCFIGFGWGAFNVGVPAFATMEHVPHRTAWILATMFVFSLPLAITYPGVVTGNRGGLSWPLRRRHPGVLLGSHGGGPSPRKRNICNGMALDCRRVS